MHSFTDSDLPDADNIVPFKNITSVNLSNLLCIFLYFAIFILINRSSIFERYSNSSALKLSPLNMEFLLFVDLCGCIHLLT